MRSLLFYTVTNLEAFIFCFAGEYLKNKVKLDIIITMTIINNNYYFEFVGKRNSNTHQDNFLTIFIFFRAKLSELQRTIPPGTKWNLKTAVI